jgi:ABC-2 type transport system permease protein
MISRVSLFNSGIFKSAIKRNIWGSVIYFIILFLMTSMPLISNINNDYFFGRTYNVPLLYRDGYLFAPVMLSVVVPTVVAMLLYRFLHSKRTAVFVHGLPVTRSANYISTLCAGFVVMTLPVIVNTMILAVLSVAVYYLEGL